MYDKAVSNELFVLKNCLNRYKTQEIWDKAVDDFLPALTFVTDWFATKQMIKKLHDDLFSDDDIIFVNKDSNYVTFFSNAMKFLG